MSTKNSNDTIGNQSRDLPTCSAMPQPTALTSAPNNTAMKYFTHIGEVRSVDWIFIFGAPAWRWLGQYVTLDRTF